ncbi:MAG: TRAP transporter substrate-binding protein [Pseudolabrys sp.]|jgi:TRAP-type C4-dicarboxylate transport system substrate-binding protein
MISRRTLLGTAAAGATLVAMPNVLRAAPKKLKLSHYLPPKHQINTELNRWADELRQKSNGELDIEVFPAGQMGPPPRQFDLARTGVSDISFFFTALVPGRFPLSEALGAPFLFTNAGGKPLSAAQASFIGTNLRDDLAAEFAGTELLYSVVSPTVGFFMRDKMVKTPDDVKGLKIRPTSVTMGSHLKAWGAAPTTIAPAEVSDAIAKGVIDGAIFNCEGGAAFQLHQSVRKVSMFGDSAAPFALVMNSGVLKGLPKDMQKLIADTTGPEGGRRVGQLYDDAEAAGRKVFAQAGVEIIDLDGAAIEPFKKLADVPTEEQIAALEAKGLKARALLAKARGMVAQA